MSVAFWSESVSAKKEVEVQPPEGYVLNFTNAALETGSSAVLRVKTVSIEGNELDAVLCTLSKNHSQNMLGLVFGYDVPFRFKVVGDGVVHLSGYFQPAPEDDEEGDDDDDEESDEEETNAKVAAVNAAINKVSDPKGKIVVEAEEDDDEEDSEEDDEDNEVDAKFIQVANNTYSILVYIYRH
jgi:hypothetical protein